MFRLKKMGRRRHESRLMYPWARYAIGAIAIIGAFGTAYLTVVKFMGATAACPTSGCDRVLSSPYAILFGVPLTLFGCLAYLSMAILALAPLLIDANTQKELREKLEGWSSYLLFVGATSMMVFSGYLMYLLVTEFKALCLYCITSATFTVLMFALTLLGRHWQDQGQLVFTGIIVAVVALVGTLGVYAPLNSNSEIAQNIAGEVGPPVETTSGPDEIALANHLTEIDAKMYGAFWCPHCHDQKVLFGLEAAQKIPYVECAPEGANSQAELCKSVEQVKGFPTWEINGQFLSGTQSLETLASASAYTGSRNFQN